MPRNPNHLRTGWEQQSLLRPDRVQVVITVSYVSPAETAVVTVQAREGVNENLVALVTAGYATDARGTADMLAAISGSIRHAMERVEPF